jgi:type VI protein secretion system component VasF
MQPKLITLSDYVGKKKKKRNEKFLSDYLDLPHPLLRLAERKQKMVRARKFLDEQKEMQHRIRLRNEMHQMQSYLDQSAVPQDRRDQIEKVIKDLKFVLN